MIDTAEQTTTSCLACGRSLTQKHGRGHRKRLYCDDRCRQRGHRQRTQLQEQETPEVQIAALEIEIQRLQERLDIETRFRTDTQVRHFKPWLRRHTQAHDTDFFKRFLADTRLPQHASRSIYEARMRLYHYSKEDLYLFEETWKDMLCKEEQL
jgi:hypothetical protein